MARTPAEKRDAIYEVTVYNYGKRYFLTGRYGSADEARKDAPRHFRGRAVVRGVKLIKDLSPAGATVIEDKKK